MAKIYAESLKEKYKKVVEFDNIIEDLLVDDEEQLGSELDSAFQFEIKFKKTEAYLLSYIKKHGKDNVVNITEERNRVPQQKVKLPKLNIKKFDGNPLNWSTFIDCFNATVDKNSDLTNVEKFSYLKGFLEDNVLQAIDGLPLSNENYDEALDLLKTRYANPQLIVSSHMQKLIKLEKLKAPNVSELRTLYDNIEGNVRALKVIGIETAHFGPLLIPLALEKLPNAIQLQISRKLGNEKWDIDDFLRNINDEIIARENFEFLKGDGDTRDARPKTTMKVGQQIKKCVFCKSDEHYSDKCDVISDPNLRKEKLREEKRCFSCLGQSHTQSSCKKKLYCYICRKTNSHHTALCYGVKDKSSMVVKNGDSILLQTANTYISNVDESKHFFVKTLCDPASQQSYITENVAKELCLVPLRKVNVNIIPFGDKNGHVSTCKEYEIVVKSYDKQRNFSMKVLSVPSICAPIRNQNIPKAVSLNPFLKELKLADDGNHPNLPVGLLLGSDYYWKVVDGNVRKDESTGLAAVSSIFGYLLNGPICKEENSYETSTSTSMLLESHVMKLETVVNQDDVLSRDIKRLWNLDEIGINKEEKSVYENFVNDINFKNGRYVVKLPIKEYMPYIPTNKQLAEKRLIKLTERLKEDEATMKRYDDVFKEQLNCNIIEKVDEHDTGIENMTTFIPHQAVNNEKYSSKFRVVLDCSAKSKNGISLNDILYKGPTMLNNLFNLVLKFRLHNVALTADIRKAYLMIEVHESHRDLMRCLWWDDVFKEDRKMITYRFRRVIFGATPSQFLLNATINEHAKKYDEIDPEFSRTLRKGFMLMICVVVLQVMMKV